MDLRKRSNLMAEFCRISFLLLSSTTLVRIIITSYHFHWVSFMLGSCEYVLSMYTQTATSLMWDWKSLLILQVWYYIRFGCSIKDNTETSALVWRPNTCLTRTSTIIAANILLLVVSSTNVKALLLFLLYLKNYNFHICVNKKLCKDIRLSDLLHYIKH